MEGAVFAADEVRCAFACFLGRLEVGLLVSHDRCSHVWRERWDRMDAGISPTWVFEAPQWDCRPLLQPRRLDEGRAVHLESLPEPNLRGVVTSWQPPSDRVQRARVETLPRRVARRTM